MPGSLLTAATPLLCAHGGPARAVAPSPRVRAGGTQVLIQSSPLTVGGCTNTPPCASAQFVLGAARVRANGSPVLLQDSVSVCAPTGTPLTVTPLPARVRGV
jgi:hypothetical protein